MKKNHANRPKGLIFRLLLILAFLAGGPFSAVLAAETSSDYPKLLIGVGDFLTVTVVGYQRTTSMATGPSAFSNNDNNIDLPTEYLVDTDGKILFPFIGEVKVASLSQAAASALLMEKLAKYVKFPQVTVLIRESNTYNVSVMGEVAHPGKYLIRGKPNLLSILSEAGGPVQDADLGGSMLIRDGKKIGIHLNDYLMNRNFVGKDVPVFPGDILMVPKDGWPSPAEWAIIASILTSGVVVFTTLRR